MDTGIDLNRKDLDPETLLEPAGNDPSFLRLLLDGVGPATQKEAVRSNCSKAVMLLAEKHPAVLVPYWEYFAGLLKSKNSFSKYVAIYVIAELVSTDPQRRFDGVLDDFYTILGDESVAVACHTAAVSARIARARPDLAPLITHKLLVFDQVPPASRHKDLVASYIIETFRSLYPGATDAEKDQITAFVWKRQDCGSAKTRKLAKEFLKQVI